jgi:hypothetical protein
LVVLGVAASIWREPLPQRRDLLPIGAFGVLFLGVYSVTLNAAERRVDAGTSAMLIQTGPILIAILAGILLKEGFPRWLFAGCAVAFSGALLIGLANSQSSSRSGIGIALLILAAFAYATAVVIQKPVLARVSPLQVTGLGCAAGTVVCLPFTPTLIGELDDAGATAIGWMVYLGVAPTALGFATWALRPPPNERRPLGFTRLHDPSGSDPARLGAARRDAALARGRGRRALPRRRLPRPPPVAAVDDPRRLVRRVRLRPPLRRRARSDQSYIGKRAEQLSSAVDDFRRYADQVR